MKLISRDVKVFGVPGFEVLGYDDWAKQCEHEFTHNILASVSYQGLKVRAMTPRRIMFETVETVAATDGSRSSQTIEILIEKEADDIWRVTQERIIDSGGGCLK